MINSKVTLFLSDIVGFTSISAKKTPIEVINILNELYTLFDMIADKYDVYKIETIGDAYMVASGVPTRNGDMHAFNICRMACEIINATQNFRLLNLDEESNTFQIRIGIHSGKIVAGVVGRKMPRYCLFGETAQITIKMEHNSKANRIHISEDTFQIIKDSHEFITEPAKEINLGHDVKIKTYWLEARDSRFVRKIYPLEVQSEKEDEGTKDYDILSVKTNL
ncbi:hypothetical protein HZS_7339 [Henneguya salminicola]|nr:hypothetical protein HZS_7339 [Henneguya salminicola]